MDRLRSIDEFHSLCERLHLDRGAAELPTLVIPAGTCGQASGANDLIRITKRTLLERGLGDRVRLRITGCHGYCQAEPSVLVEPGRTFYPRLKLNNMARIGVCHSQRTGQHRTRAGLIISQPGSEA